MFVEAFVAQAAIEAFAKRILDGFAGLDSATSRDRELIEELPN